MKKWIRRYFNLSIIQFDFHIVMENTKNMARILQQEIETRIV